MPALIHHALARDNRQPPRFRVARSPGNYEAGYGGAKHYSANYPKEYLIKTPSTGKSQSKIMIGSVNGDDDRRLSSEDADSALLEAAKAGAHEAVSASALEDSSLPALMTEI